MIEPMPPVANIALPWDQELADPVAVISGARAQHGDTFAVRSGPDTYLFLFSAQGVRSFYELPESEASKGIADWSMIRRKLPDELFDGRRTFPHELFGRNDVRSYLHALGGALDTQLAELGDRGEFDIFAFARRLGHRMGLASWAGPESARGDRFDQLVVALDALDASEAFVHPERMAAIAANNKQHERAALAAAEKLIGETLADRAARPTSDEPDLLDRITDRWADVHEPGRTSGIGRDVVLAHLASMTNLFAALGWTIVDLVTRPALLEAVSRGDNELAERCALESIRIAQRSIMLRMVTREVEVRDGTATYRVKPGAFIATLLPLTNTTSAPGHDTYDPERWARRHLAEPSGLAARALVTTFGHGAHSCPAQSFSLSSIVQTVTRLGQTYELTPLFETAKPLPAQIGGVARAEQHCPVAYQRRR
jgi:cytochrome P450